METVFEEGKWDVTPEMLACYEEKGFIIVRHLFGEEELEKIERNIQEGKEYQTFMFMVKDEAGNQSGQVTWNYSGDDVLGAVARSEKVAGTCAKLLGEEVYHYHSKICVKDPRTGGQRAWHQDYAYWYHNGCLFPNMMTVFIAIDSASKENGCLQVIDGSHKAGRIEHGFAGNEQCADLERLEHIKGKTTLRYVELEPGDAVFFHCNLLHMSSVNTSENRRLAYLAAYNAASNDPVKESHHPRYNKLNVVPNSAILECTNYTNLDGKDFLDIPKLKSLEGQVKVGN